MFYDCFMALNVLWTSRSILAFSPNRTIGVAKKGMGHIERRYLSEKRAGYGIVVNQHEYSSPRRFRLGL